MSNVPAFITKHPVLTYFALAFGISWAGGLFVLGPGGIPTTIERLMTMGPVMYVAMLAGPSMAGLLMISILAWAAALWIVVAVIAVANGGKISRPLHWRRAA